MLASFIFVGIKIGLTCTILVVRIIVKWLNHHFLVAWAFYWLANVHLPLKICGFRIMHASFIFVGINIGLTTTKLLVRIIVKWLNHHFLIAWVFGSTGNLSWY